MKNLYFLLLFAFSGYAQDFEWLQLPPMSISTNPDLIGYVTACDATGNIYMSGFQDTPTNYNDTFGRVFFNKYNDSGQLQYSNILGGKVSVYDIDIDPSGHVILALGYLDSIIIDGTTVSSTAIGVKPLVAKFTPDGHMAWYYQPLIDGNLASYFKALATDLHGNIFLGFDDFNASYIEKLDPDGHSQMLITQNHVSLLSSVDTDIEGNIYAAGSCADLGSTFGGTAVSTAFFYNSYVVKYSPEGVYQWVRFVDDITCPKPQVCANTPDEVYFTSALPDNYTFDGIATEGPMTGMFSDFFLTRLNASGTFQWVREIPGAGQVYGGKRNYLDCDASGNVYFSGNTRGSINWGNGMTSSPPNFASEALLLKYNAAGELLMVKTAGGASEDRFDGVAINGEGDIFLSGMVRGSAAFGSLQHTGEGVTVYAFLTKIKNETLGIADHQKANFNIYPNPAGDYFYIDNPQKMPGSVYNIFGQRLIDFESDSHTPVNIKNLSAGVYIVNVGGSSRKIVKN